MGKKRDDVRMGDAKEVLAAIAAFYAQAGEAEPAGPSVSKEAA